MPLPESEDFNVQFVQLVQGHRNLYDTTSPFYTSKKEQEAAWSNVALAFSSTVEECKVRWKHLRGGLTRYIKKLNELSEKEPRKLNRTKQFYLYDVMQFVIPFLKSRTYHAALPFYTITENENEGELLDIGDGEAPELGTLYKVFQPDDDDINPDVVFPTPTSSSSSKRGKKRSRSRSRSGSRSNSPVADQLEEVKFDYDSKTPFDHSEENPDLNFLKSILPDMATLNSSQKRQFKLRILTLLDEFSTQNKNSSRSGGVSINSISSTDPAFSDEKL